MYDLFLIVAVVMNIGFGLATVWKPELIARGTHVTLMGARGTAEFRVAFGGYFIGMGLALLLLSEPEAAAAIGIAWAGAAVMRGVEVVRAFATDTTRIFNRAFFIIWASEIITAALLLAQLAR